jgi:hypothetical protein
VAQYRRTTESIFNVLICIGLQGLSGANAVGLQADTTGTPTIVYRTVTMVTTSAWMQLGMQCIRFVNSDKLQLKNRGNKSNNPIRSFIYMCARALASCFVYIATPTMDAVREFAFGF